MKSEKVKIQERKPDVATEPESKEDETDHPGLSVPLVIRQDEDEQLEKPVLGLVLYRSWGYDQTNVNFYKIVELIGKTSFLAVELQQEMVSSDHGAFSGSVIAVNKPNRRSDESINLLKGALRKSKWGSRNFRVQAYHEYENVSPWNGRPKSFSSDR